MAEAVRNDVLLEPVRIVGVPANYALLRAVAAGFVTLGTAVVRLLVE